MKPSDVQMPVSAYCNRRAPAFNSMVRHVVQAAARTSQGAPASAP